MSKLALLIEVSEYDAGLPPLPGAQRDVGAMERVLQNPQRGNFDDVGLLSNPSPTEMQLAIETLFLENRHKDDLVLLYISSHGVRDDDACLHLVTRTTQLRQSGQIFTATAVPASFIQSCMSRSRSRRQVLILDCCFSGAFAEGMQAKSLEQPLSIQKQLGGEGRAVLTSSTATQVSYAEEDASIYTRYLVEGIETGAADLNKDGAITIDELHQYAKRRTQEAAPAMKPEIFAIREGYTIQLAKAPQGDPKLVYRKECEQRLVGGKATSVGRSILDKLQKELNLASEDAIEIEYEVLEPFQRYQSNLQEYRQVLAEAMAHESPLSAQTQEELQRLQQLLKLRDEDVGSTLSVEESILPAVHRQQQEPEPPVKRSRTPGQTGKWLPRKPHWTLTFMTIAACVVIPAGIYTTGFKRSTTFADVVNDVPSLGEFSYTGSSTWSSIRCGDGQTGIDTVFEWGLNSLKNFKPRYKLPTEIDPTSKEKPSSNIAIDLLIDKEKDVAFAVSSRPLTDAEKKKAEAKGFTLEAIPVARDITVVIVNSKLDIGKIGGLLVNDLKEIYTSNRTLKWQKFRGTNQTITPYTHQAEKQSKYLFQKIVLADAPFGSTVQFVETTSDGMKKVESELGAIYHAPAALVYRNSNIKIMPIVGTTNTPVLPFKVFDPKKGCEPKNEDSILTSSKGSSPVQLNPAYPKALQQEVVSVIVKHYKGSASPAQHNQELAGLAYAKLLRTDQGQQIMRQMGFQPYAQQ